MNDKTCLKSMLPEELKEYMVSIGEPGYRAAQVFRWMMQGVTSFDGMSDLSKPLRAKLDGIAKITRPEIVRKQVSAKDGTVKYLFGLEDGNCVETVVMKYEHGNSVCLSTQAGCHMGCAFCASFEKGETRNLTPAEILDQVLFAGIDSGLKISNIVLMGTGEPLDKLRQRDSVFKAGEPPRWAEYRYAPYFALHLRPGAAHLRTGQAGFAAHPFHLAARAYQRHPQHDYAGEQHLPGGTADAGLPRLFCGHRAAHLL